VSRGWQQSGRLCRREFWRKPQWLKLEVRVRVKHLQGRDTLRHASVQGLVTWNSTASSQLA
jgi:hypothetical protein